MEHLGGLTMVLLTIGAVLALVGLAEWLDHRSFEKWKKKNRNRFFDIEK